jgi:dihydrofolate synthase/folylpolyglutamate synthase
VFTSSLEVFNWLEKFINLERGQKPKSFRMDRMEFLCELAGNPHQCAPSIHIAGSKGKGSVTSILTSILTAAGFRAARYMSPHVVDVRERICLGNEYFSEEVYCTAGNKLHELIEKELPAADNPLFDESNPDGCEPTYFELFTLFFFLCAKYGKCDVITAETGMGGRLDSTNVLDPLVSVITLIELEHTLFLGDTIKAIAAEKAGIIKPGKPVILAKQCEEALQVFQKAAKEKNSQLVYFPETTELSEVKITANNTSFNLKINPKLHFCAYSIPIPGKVQAENAALAITALKTAFPDINEDAVRSGLANLKIPARFEKISNTPPFIIDGAHTPESLELCIETFCSLYGEGGILLFGCAADKDASAMAKITCNYFSKIIITSIGAFKTNDPKKVYEAFVKYEKEKVLLIMDIQEAINQAVEFAQNNKLPVLGTGSFYLVSEIRKSLKT